MNGVDACTPDVHSQAAHSPQGATASTCLNDAVWLVDGRHAGSSLCAITPIVHIQTNNSAVTRETRVHKFGLRLLIAASVMNRKRREPNP